MILMNVKERTVDADLHHSIQYHGVSLEPSSSGWRVRGHYEQHEMQLCQLLLRPGQKTLVAGAGFGWLAAWCAAIVGPQNLVAVEPNPVIAGFAAANVEVDHTPLCWITGGLTAGENTMARFFHHRNWAKSSFRRGDDANMITFVPVFNLAQLIEHHQIEALVLDVEGSEYELLMDTPLDRLSTIVLEFHGTMLSAACRATLRHHLATSGFRVIAEYRRADEPIFFLGLHR
jgi:FkbM family methyltransferase